MSEPSVPLVQAFISYHSGDSAWVGQLVAALRERNVPVWLDRDEIRPGDVFPAALEKALDSVSCVVFVISTGSMRSPWVREEYHRSLVRTNSAEGNLRLIAVLIDDAERPPGFMGSRTWVDFRDPKGFARSADTLARAILGQPSSDVEGAPSDVADRGDAGVPVNYAPMLETLIDRTNAAIQRFLYIRVGGACAGGVCAGGIVTAMGVSDALKAPVGLYVALPLTGAVFTGLVAWAATLRNLANYRRDLHSLVLLRDGLHTCASRTLPACRRLREVFWTRIEREVDHGLPSTGRPGN